MLKPRFGSWGREVHRCDDPAALDAALAGVRNSSWYRRHGALVQELVPPQGYDLRVLVAGGRVVGSVFRVAAPGEWRTNIALGGVRLAVSEPPRDAAALALDAARVAGAALAGVDLLPDGRGGWVVAELNGAVGSPTSTRRGTTRSPRRLPRSFARLSSGTARRRPSHPSRLPIPRSIRAAHCYTLARAAA